MKNRESTLKKLDHLAWLLDSSIRIPGTTWRIGLDGIIGMIPGIGDLGAGAISTYIIVQGVRAGASPFVVLHMILNVMLETLIGVIPVIGDLFDFIFKANQRNTHLLRNCLEQPVSVKNKSMIKVLLAGIMIAGMLVFLVYITVLILSALLKAVL